MWIKLLMVIILIETAFAMDEELFIPIQGDEEMYHNIAGDEELGVFFTYLEEVVAVGEPVAGAGVSATYGARGGGCDVFADEFKTCFHIDPINLTCVPGCPPDYMCNSSYRCEYIVLETKEKKNFYALGIIVTLILSVSYIVSCEIKKVKGKKIVKKEEKKEELK